MKVVITGGAGFLGSHLVDALAHNGDEVVVYDTLVSQVHTQGPPDWLNPTARYVFADPRCGGFERDCQNADALVHLAAATGTGQSMYQAASYTRDNAELTAALVDGLVDGRIRPGRVIFASSRAVYGEGAALCGDCGVVFPGPRDRRRMAAGEWAAPCPHCRQSTTWAATNEEAPRRPVSVYGATKLFGEQILSLGAADAGIGVTTLRFFNLFGPRQTPTNPYVGVVAVFAAAVSEGRPIHLFEDGDVVRDFCHVQDAVGALLAALDAPDAVTSAVNIGAGVPTTLRALAEAVVTSSGGDPGSWPVVVTGQTRSGDLRCCVADIRRAEELLGWTPHVSLNAGLPDVLDYVHGRPAADITGAIRELAQRGMLIGNAS